MKIFRKFWQTNQYLFNVRDYNLAEWIPLIRLMSVPVFIWIFTADLRILAGWFFLLSFCSDGLDGFLGRTFNWYTERLAKLDSLADMCLLGAALWAFIYFEPAFAQENAYWIGITLGFYFIQWVYGLLRYGESSSFHTVAARVAAIIQVIFFAYTFIVGLVPWLFFTMIAFSLLETIQEIILICLLPKWQVSVKSFWVVIFNLDKYRNRES